MKKVFILTGESSGELYGALLSRSLKKRWNDIRILGVGGERMRREGVEIIAGISGAFGVVELVSSLKKIKETFRTVVRTITAEKPDVVVLIDFPDFNIKVAKAVRSTGAKILYYVSPQVWAWRRKRVHTIAEISDYVAVILPFEQEYYRDTHAKCEFVGHPIFEEFEADLSKRGAVKDSLGLKNDKPVLALLPGSRDSELSRLLPVMRGFIGMFQPHYPDYQLIMPIAPNVDKTRYGSHFDALASQGVRLVDGESVKVLSTSDLAVVASGTAALQAAFLGIPLVVVYKLFPLTYFLGKMIVQVKYVNLVNIMQNEMVIKELLQKQANPRNIFQEVERMITDTHHRELLLGKFRQVRSLFDNKHASERVGAIIGELAGWK
ncbi:MAG: lipid-A-disaccharide synthase [bacterium]